MRTDTAPSISRHDYQPYPYRLPSVALQFDLHAQITRVCATLEVERQGSALSPMVLNGQELKLVSVSIDGTELHANDYQLSDETLTLHPRTERFTLEIVSECCPAENSALMGLY